MKKQTKKEKRTINIVHELFYLFTFVIATWAPLFFVKVSLSEEVFSQLLPVWILASGILIFAKLYYLACCIDDMAKEATK